MFKHLLLATDGSAEGEKALAESLTLAEALSAKVTVATVTEPWTEAAYATLPTPSLVRIYEEAAAGMPPPFSSARRRPPTRPGFRA